MFCGVSLFGLLTANVSAKFLKNDALLAYEQLAELVDAGQPCPNCGHTPSLRVNETDGVGAPGAMADTEPAETAAAS